MFRLCIVLALPAIAFGIVDHVGCQESACNSTECLDGYTLVAQNGRTSCQKSCTGTTDACFAQIKAFVDATASNSGSGFGWVSSENGTNRVVGYQNCSAQCNTKTYTVQELTAFRNLGMETYSSAYPTPSRRRSESHSTQHQVLTNVAASDDDDDTDVVPIIIGVSAGVVGLVALFFVVRYYRKGKGTSSSFDIGMQLM